VALAGSPGSKAMKQVSQQILSFAVKVAAESMQTWNDCLSLVSLIYVRENGFYG
jgi:hypothetical protein